MTKLLTLGLLFLLTSCQSESKAPDSLKYVELKSPAGKTIKVTVSYTMAEQEQGLSGKKPEDFAADQGMLFFYGEDNEKYFWMPDTYFDLDLFYLDAKFKVIDIIRKLPHYIGRNNPDLIPKARGVWCRHVLEMKADSPLAAEIKTGDQLTWIHKFSPEEFEAKLKAEPVKP